MFERILTTKWHLFRTREFIFLLKCTKSVIENLTPLGKLIYPNPRQGLRSQAPPVGKALRPHVRTHCPSSGG